MIATVRSVREWWMGVAIALIMISFILGGTEIYELYKLHILSSQGAVRATGKLELTAKSLKFRSAGIIILDCPRYRCGYPGMEADAGKEVTAYLTDGRILAVQIDGTHRDTLALVNGQKKNRIMWYVIQLFFGISIFILTYKGRSRGVGRYF
ncbi:hypothetical protein [Acidovorax sp. SUPP2539]|uniref:hypothetical protein n=1 Tax=Acidovorax sp. SUPP2539 TaxID=2920878 RepID=UPI0023DE51D8|nr:hypothetical protein [Acidovorax sp. SUPP2539]GKS91506.1 hypothetical protein AVTE2539_19095 [Acidovorax sp. SUPP2539]